MHADSRAVKSILSSKEEEHTLTEQLSRLKESNLTVVCNECRKEFKGAGARDQHTDETGHKDFHPKPASFPKKEGTE
jgi:hypothetical protein